jgi:SPP1 gp7 family putative phage head morphogenesis protein
MQVLNGYDPTRTTTLRNQFAAEMGRRFRRLRGLVRKAIIQQDCFGLKRNDSLFLVQTDLPRFRQFDFPRSSDKIEAFMEWFREVEGNEILDLADRHRVTQIGRGVEEAWTNLYVQTAYQKGIVRARNELRRAGVDIPVTETGGELNVAFNQPFHLDRVGLLYTRVFSDLKGITTAMDTQISRVLAQGIADGKNPIPLADLLVKTISGPVGDLGITDTLGRFIPAERRAKMLARTEIIRAHAQASLQEYKNWGVEGVTAEVEFVTAGDGRVCPICAGMQGRTYSLEQAGNVIPVHPQCFIDRQIPIYTSRGWKKIGDIQLGDLVLTHKGRFRKVTKLYITPKQKPKVIRFFIKGFQNGGLTMTEDHPVLVTQAGITMSRWKSAKDVVETDQILLLASKCARCGISIPYFRKYCSHTCQSLDVTDQQWSDPAHRKNISNKAKIQMLREYSTGQRDPFVITKKANSSTRRMVQEGMHPFQQEEVRERMKKVTNLPKHRKASSKRMKLNNPMKDPVIRKKATLSLEKFLEEHPEKRLNSRMAKHRKSGKKTWIEERMAQLLDHLGIHYVFQYPILRYDVDFAIPHLKIAIECDGEYWHQDKKKDAVRQKRIENEGWFVLRYTGKKINQCLNEIEMELSRVFMNHTGDYEFIKYPISKIETRELKRSRTLYNFSVEEDESYIAKGMIVHNCRCAWLPKVVED